MAQARCSQAASDVGQVRAWPRLLVTSRRLPSSRNVALEGASWPVLSAMPSCWSVDVYHSLAAPSWLLVVANRRAVGSKAILAIGPAATATGPATSVLL